MYFESSFITKKSTNQQPNLSITFTLNDTKFMFTFDSFDIKLNETNKRRKANGN